MKFWNFKYENNWHEVTSDKGVNKPLVLSELKNKGYNITNKDLWSCINAPDQCPLVFSKTLLHISVKQKPSKD